MKNLKNKSLQKLAQLQDHVCTTCGESLYNGEELHKHHKIPRSQGGLDTSKNLELVHLYCHQQIHGKRLVDSLSGLKGNFHEPFLGGEGAAMLQNYPTTYAQA